MNGAHRLLLAVAPLAMSATNPADLAGSYRIEQMEMAGGLELETNGHFHYLLSYGAADEVGEGDWKLDGNTVRLTSKPMPRPPAFEVAGDKISATRTLNIAVDWGPLNWSSPPDLFVGYQGDAELQFASVEQNGEVHLEQCGVDTVLVLVPVYRTPTKPVRIDPSRGHALSLRFVPNDLGHAAFHGEPLHIDGDDLVMDRYETKIRFVRNRD